MSLTPVPFAPFEGLDTTRAPAPTLPPDVAVAETLPPPALDVVTPDNMASFFEMFDRRLTQHAAELRSMVNGVQTLLAEHYHGEGLARAELELRVTRLEKGYAEDAEFDA